MAKLHVRGTARREFPADRFTFQITVFGAGATAGMAAESGRASVEDFLRKASDVLHIAPEQFTLEDESLTESYGAEAGYRFSKSMSLVTDADLQTVAALSKLTEQMRHVTYRLEYGCADMAALEQEVMRAAIADSRAKAEQIAAGLGAEITGAGDVRFEVPDDAGRPEMLRCAAAYGACNDMAAQMQLPVVTVSKEIFIVWETA